MIRVQGAAAAKEQLDDMAAALLQNVKAAMTAEAAELEAEARRRCPVDTGGLRDSIRAGVRAQDADIEAVVGSTLDYAAPMELGTLHHPPAPYLAPAYRARKDALTGHIKQAVRRAMEGEIE